jgi:hypothetical protein
MVHDRYPSSSRCWRKQWSKSPRRLSSGVDNSTDQTGEGVEGVLAVERRSRLTLLLMLKTGGARVCSLHSIKRILAVLRSPYSTVVAHPSDTPA